MSHQGLADAEWTMFIAPLSSTGLNGDGACGQVAIHYTMVSDDNGAPGRNGTGDTGIHLNLFGIGGVHEGHVGTFLDDESTALDFPDDGAFGPENSIS